MVTATELASLPEVPGTVKLPRPAGAVRRGPAAGVSGFTVQNRWLGGSRSRSMVARPGIAETKRPAEAPKGIFIESSADQLLNSGELAPHPVEFLLHGIAASVTESVARMALLRGVSIDGIESRAEARFTRSLLNGELMDCEQVQVKVAIQSDASAETVQDMFTAAVERAPVFSVFGGQAPVIFGLV